jgi:hypothetical protein
LPEAISGARSSPSPFLRACADLVLEQYPGDGTAFRFGGIEQRRSGITADCGSISGDHVLRAQRLRLAGASIRKLAGNAIGLHREARQRDIESHAAWRQGFSEPVQHRLQQVCTQPQLAAGDAARFSDEPRPGCGRLISLLARLSVQIINLPNLGGVTTARIATSTG